MQKMYACMDFIWQQGATGKIEVEMAVPSKNLKICRDNVSHPLAIHPYA